MVIIFTPQITPCSSQDMVKTDRYGMYSLDSYNKALKIDEELNDRVGMARKYANIGIVLDDIDKLEALESNNKALEINEELNHKAEVATDYYNISFVLSKTSSTHG